MQKATKEEWVNWLAHSGIRHFTALTFTDLPQCKSSGKAAHKTNCCISETPLSIEGDLITEESISRGLLYLNINRTELLTRI